MSTPAHLTRGLAALGLLALALLTGSSPAQAQSGESLVPRPAPQKPEQATVPPGYSRERIHLKFTEGTGVRLRGGHFQLGTGAELSSVEAVLAQYPGTRAQRLFSRSEGVLADEKPRIERESGREQADLNLYYRLVLRPGSNTVGLLDALNGLDVVEIAYAEPLPEPPPATPDFTARQRYRLAAGVGVDALYANAIPGGTGSNVEIIDVEYSWDQNHEDLSKAVGALIPNGTPSDPFSDSNHGTAVLGEVIADQNSFGVTGIAHGALLGLVNANNVENGYDLADSIDTAHANLTNGDVILIEQQIGGPNGCVNGSSGCVPVEWVQAFYDAIVRAVSDGIVVVEAAGNGNEDLDDTATYGSPFPAGRADSGAIIVGAGAAGSAAHVGCTGTNPAHGRMSFSTHGTRVNVQGWGECVATTGYGGLQSSPNPLYTNSFSGTSSASPIVTSAAAIVSSVAQQRGFTLLPTQIRALLKDTGTPQAFGLSGNIGPLPNLRSALESVAADRFSSALLLSRASTTRTRDSNAAASKEPGEPNHHGNVGGASIWYRWTPTDSGKVTIDTDGSTFDTLLAVYTGTAVGSLSFIASDDDGGAGLQSKLSFFANAGTTYRIAVDGFNGATGAADLRLDQSPRAPGARAVADFDNDGFADLAIGAAGENSGSTPNAGAVNVLYGSAGGLASAGARQFNQSQAGGTAEAHDRFGSALAAGDFNGDGFDDLAIGVPDEDAGSSADVGVINVLRGSASGLTSTGAAQFTQAQAAGVSSAGDRFGAALTAGNFSGTTADELAVGTPDENSGFSSDVGVINVLRGSASGLTSTGAAQFTQSQAAGTSETNDRFGAALAAGNFSGDGFAELAVGAPDEDVGSAPDAGAINVLRGASGGLTGSGAAQFTQAQAAGTSETDDRFGAALAAGNFSGDGFAELAIGAPDEDSGATAAVGVVNILRGASGGLTGSGAAQFTQAQAAGTVEVEDRFGTALAAGNLSGDGFAELAVGAPDEDSGSTAAVGVINVLRGAAAGLTGTGALQFTQAQAAGGTEADDRFGAALTAGNFNADGFADVAAGAPDEDAGSSVDIGVVNILRGASAGLTSTGAQQFTQSQARGTAAAGDQFGGAVG